jgi:MFS family permease
MFGRGAGDTYIVFIASLEKEFGWSRSQLTSVYSVYLLVGGCVAPVVGLIFDRLGPRVVYAFGLAVLGAAFFLAGSLGNLWEFYLFVGVMIGVGVGLTGMVPASGLLTRWYRDKLSTAIGIAFSATGMGALTLVPLSQYLIGEYDWRTAYKILGSVLCVLCVLSTLFVPWGRFARGHPDYRVDGREKSSAGGWTLKSAMRTRIYWGLVRVFFFTSTAMYTVTVQTVVYFIDTGFSPITAATAYGFIGMLSVCSVAMSGFLSDRFGFRQTVTASFVGTTAGIMVLFALTYAPWAALLVLYVLVFGLCQGMRGPIISTIATRHFAGARVATIYGTIYATNAVGAAFGSLMGGVLHDVTGGYRAGFVFSLCAITMAVLPFWTIPVLRNFR